MVYIYFYLLLELICQYFIMESCCFVDMVVLFFNVFEFGVEVMLASIAK